jgi:FkbM family methyltransferase
MNFFRRFFPKQDVEIAINKKQLAQYLPSNPVILEAGVCDGADTEEFARCFPLGKIHGFECLPYYQEVAKKRLERYPNVTLYPFALSDQCGELDFHVSTRQGEFFGSGSILTPKLHKEVHPQIVFKDTIRVQGITIDDWAQRYHIGPVDFLWLDLQGAEIKALKGSTRTLGHVKGIFTEVSLIETYEGVPLYDEVKAFLLSKGFTVKKEYLPYKDMGNVLFIK